jgi:hypothetical protein
MSQILSGVNRDAKMYRLSALTHQYCFLKCRRNLFFHFLHLHIKKCKYIFVWKQCKGSTTKSKLYQVTRRFILQWNIVVYKETEHCFHSRAAVCMSMTHCVFFSASNVTTVYAIAEAVSRWLPTAEAWVWQVGFVVDKVASGQVFSEYFGFPYTASVRARAKIYL